MAFTIKKRESYRWTVEHVLEKRQGKHEVMAFDVEFKAMPQSRIEKLLEQARDLKINDLDFMAEVLVGWHGLDDESGSAFAYSRAHLEHLLEQYPGIAASFSRAWTESVLGGAAARKN